MIVDAGARDLRVSSPDRVIFPMTERSQGGAWRAHLHRLQPERPRSHDCLGLQRPPAQPGGRFDGSSNRARRRSARSASPSHPSAGPSSALGNPRKAAHHRTDLVRSSPSAVADVCKGRPRKPCPPRGRVSPPGEGERPRRGVARSRVGRNAAAGRAPARAAALREERKRSRRAGFVSGTHGRRRCNQATKASSRRAGLSDRECGAGSCKAGPSPACHVGTKAAAFCPLFPRSVAGRGQNAREFHIKPLRNSETKRGGSSRFLDPASDRLPRCRLASRKGATDD
jgi:hypothetical protein